MATSRLSELQELRLNEQTPVGQDGPPTVRGLDVAPSGLTLTQVNAGGVCVA